MSFPSFYQHFLREEVVSVELFSDIMARAREEFTSDPTLMDKDYSNYMRNYNMHDRYNRIHNIRQGSVAAKVKSKTTAGPDLDHIMWYKPSYRERVKAETATKVNKFKFRFVYIDISASEISQALSTTDLYKALKMMESIIGSQPGVITFAFNTSAHESPDDFMKLGADKGGVFMIGHKLGHAARTAHNLFDYKFNISAVLSSIEYTVSKLRERYPFKYFSNLKSVQTYRNETSIEEFTYDLFGQYLKFGRVTFRPMHPDAEAEAEKLKEISAKVTSQIEEILSSMVGRVVFDVV